MTIYDAIMVNYTSILIHDCEPNMLRSTASTHGLIRKKQIVAAESFYLELPS